MFFGPQKVLAHGQCASRDGNKELSEKLGRNDLCPDCGLPYSLRG